MAKTQIESKSGIRIVLSSGGKSFMIAVAHPRWTLEGTIDGTISGERIVKGKDKIGRFQEIVFTSTRKISYRCSIRTYENRSVLLFNQEGLDSLSQAPQAFPIFSKFPDGLSLMTFSEREFGAPTIFRQFDTPPDSAHGLHSGPLVLFDSSCNACIISPASNFMVASISENGAEVRCGLNAGMVYIPKGFVQSTILAVESGINRTWDTWGRTVTDLYQKKRQPNDADVGLKYLGYWTDNGASYYYHYDTAKGYEGTLLALKKRYDQVHIPIRSMQLDSWWYAKGYDNPDGGLDRSERRIPGLPAGTWNRFGGLTQYEAPSDLFPRGLKGFHDSLNMPLITHNRWISRDSPYRDKYTISGIGVVDRRWWSEIMKSISSWGVTIYEQDWLDRIYNFSPEFSLTTWAGEDFMNGMALAARKEGLTIQYCMALPRHYLEGGAKYPEVTTIRVSGDRFQMDRWKEFLYGSRLASALGIWPWCDVFMSRETPNILLATLSAGIVGIGDAIGDEDVRNIHRSVRADGVIVKPDVPIVPTDRAYINDSKGKGIRVATTYSEHGAGLKTFYVYAYADSPECKRIIVPASEIGITKEMFLYDYFAGTGKIIEPGDSVSLNVAHDSCCYVILAPIGRNGVAFIGDPDKFVTCGKKRINSLVESKGVLRATILMAKGEQSVAVCGYAPKMPQFLIYDGFLASSDFDPVHHIFKLEINPSEGLKYDIKNGDTTGKITVEFKASK